MELDIKNEDVEEVFTNLSRLIQTNWNIPVPPPQHEVQKTVVEPDNRPWYQRIIGYQPGPIEDAIYEYNQTTTQPEYYHLHKLLIIGPDGIGKSNLLM